MKQISTEMVNKAIEDHCASAGLTFCNEDENGHARWKLMSPVEGAQDIIVRLVDNKLACEDSATKMAVSEILMELLEDEKTTGSPKPAVRPVSRHVAPAKPQTSPNKHPGESMVDTWRARQARGYFVKGGKAEVPNAFAVSEEANRRRFNVETDGGRTGEIAWGKARAIDTVTGNFREAKVTFDWSTFRQRQAWEITKNMEKKNPGVVLGIDPETMLPMLDSNIKIDGQPAALYLHLQLLRQWTFADRTAESMAERRAVLKLSNREWREDDEVDVERLEEIAVGEMRG